MATLIHEPQILLNKEEKFILPENDPFPKPLLMISERLLEITVQEINNLSGYTFTIRDIVESSTEVFALRGRVIFLTIAKKNLFSLFPKLSRLFLPSDYCHNNLSDVQKKFENDELYQSILSAARRRFNVESVKPQPLFEYYEQLNLVGNDLQLKRLNLKLLRKYQPVDVAELLFTAIKSQDNSMTKEVIRSQTRIPEIIWRRIWIAVILREIYKKKISYDKIGETISIEPKKHSAINHYIKYRHSELMDENEEYKDGFHKVRETLFSAF